MILGVVVGCGSGNSDEPSGENVNVSSQDHVIVVDTNNNPNNKEKPPPLSRDMPNARKILYIVIDALRADRLGSYGFEQPTSPVLDKLASQGVVFENVHAASPWTAPSFGTLFTGVSPTVHGAGAMLVKGSSEGTLLFGVTVGGIRKNLPTIGELLPKEMKKGAIINNSFVCEAIGFARGFDDFDHRNAKLTRYRQADEITDSSIAWLEINKSDPFFLMVHYFDPHIQYGPPEKYLPQFAPGKPGRIGYPFKDHDPARDGTLNPSEKEKDYIKGLYNAEVRFADDEIGRLIEAMEKLDLMNDTWIIVTSDHGEEHFEHGSFEHGHRYEEEVVRVPLIIRAPGGKWYAGKRVKENVSHVDILPTVMRLMSLPPKSHFEGRSLLPLIEGKETGDRVSYMEFNLFHGQQCALYDGQYKVVWDLRRKRGFMYDLKADPGEARKLDDSHPKYKSMHDRLFATRDKLEQASMGKIANDGALSPEAAEALKSLGYIK